MVDPVERCQVQVNLDKSDGSVAKNLSGLSKSDLLVSGLSRYTCPMFGLLASWKSLSSMSLSLMIMSDCVVALV